jgi:HEAT repeat protein
MATQARRSAAIAGHRDNVDELRQHLSSGDGNVRATALRSLARCEQLTVDDLVAHMADRDPIVRRAVATLMADYPLVETRFVDALLNDGDETVREVAAWMCGEHERVADSTLNRLIELAQSDSTPLVREAAIAALGAIGDDRAVEAIVGGTRDKPAIRRRAVIALVPFDGPGVDDAWQRALIDRDWQVRQLAEDLGPQGPSLP